MVSTMTNSETLAIPAGYKQTEVGVVPDDWSVAPLNEICDFGGGTTPPRAQHERYFINGSNNWVKTTDLNNSLIGVSEEQITDLAVSETGLKLHPIGSVLVAMYGGFNQIGRTGYITRPSAINQALVAIKPKPKKLESYYLLSQLNYNVGYWKGVASSSRKDPNITSNDVKNYPLAFPLVKEQTAIANALSDVDNLIAALETLIAKKSAIKTAAMQQLLTGKKRLPAFAGEREGQHLKANEQCNAKPNEQHRTQPNSASDTPSQHHSDAENSHHQHTPRPGYKHTELGEIPEDWEVKLIGELSSSYSGGTPSTGNSSYYGGDIPWITSGDLNKVRINSVSGRITEKGLQNSSAKMVDKGALLFALYGATAGIAAITNCTGAINQAILAIMPNNNCDIEFLFQIFRMRKSYFIETYTQGGQPNFSGSIVKAFAVAIPTTKKEQTAIANVLSDMDTELDALQQRLSKTKTIKQGMMQELLTGKTRLI